MSEINRVFIYNGKPQNGATAKLWRIAGFASYTDSTDTVQDDPLLIDEVIVNVTNGALFADGDVIRMEDENCLITDIVANVLHVVRGYQGTAPAEHAVTTQIDIQDINEPSQDDSEPAAGFQQGASLTTGVDYGGDGAFRWDTVPAGEYYVSCYYDNHRAFLYFKVREAVTFEVLDGKGDVGTSDHQLAQGNHTHAFVITEEWAIATFMTALLDWNTEREINIPAADTIVVWTTAGSNGPGNTGSSRILVDDVEKITCSATGSSGWFGAGVQYAGAGGNIKHQCKTDAGQGGGQSGMYSIAY